MRTEYDYSGEDTETEIIAIHKFFPSFDIVKEDNYKGQVKGTDYYITKGVKKGKIDTKIHYYDSDILVYEIDDNRPRYKGHAWGDPNSNKETDFLIWIVASKNKAYLFNYRLLVNNYTNFITDYEHKSYMDTRWGTVNLWLPIEDLKSIDNLILKEIDLDCYRLKDKIKQNFYKPAMKKSYLAFKEEFEQAVEKMSSMSWFSTEDVKYFDSLQYNTNFNQLRRDESLAREVRLYYIITDKMK